MSKFINGKVYKVSPIKISMDDGYGNFEKNKSSKEELEIILCGGRWYTDLKFNEFIYKGKGSETILIPSLTKDNYYYVIEKYWCD